MFGITRNERNREMWLIRLVVCIIALVFIATSMPLEAHAASKNSKARNAYKKAMATSQNFGWLRDYIGSSGAEYKFMDLNKDSIDELIIETYQDDRIFTYRKGRVVDLKATKDKFSNSWMYYYKSNNTVHSNGGHSGKYWDVYTKIYKSKAKILARAYGTDYDPKTEMSWSDGSDIKFKYYVKGKKVSKRKYNSYVKSITKGKRKVIKNYKTLTNKDIADWKKIN